MCKSPAQVELFQSLVELAYADDDYSDLEDELLNDIGSGLKLPEATILQIKAHVETEYYKRKRIMSSSAGLLAALVILFIFVMTATFLRSVFFGLTLAYFFLPLQRWYERQVFSRTLVHRLLAIPRAGAAPLRGSIRGVRNLFSASPSLTPTPTPQALPARQQLARVNRSCYATVLTFVLILLAVGSIIFWSVGNTYEKLRHQLEAGTEHPVAPKSGVVPVADANTRGLRALEQRLLDSLPTNLKDFAAGWLHWAVVNVRETLKDKDKMYALLGTVLNMSGGVAKGAFGLVGMGFAICLDALLTLFFWLFGISRGN